MDSLASDNSRRNIEFGMEELALWDPELGRPCTAPCLHTRVVYYMTSSSATQTRTSALQVDSPALLVRKQSGKQAVAWYTCPCR